MKVLLDTCTFLWIALDASPLSRVARETYRTCDNEVYLSTVSAWEITVKHALGRLPLPSSPATFVPALREAHEIESLPLREEESLYLHRLPTLHRDPFDRMLVCQAIVGGMLLLTPDPAIQQYPVRANW
ncbi:MAG: type II toxin-antitoxin system VapC family toxin [Planctomycetota bacterium]